MNVVHNAIWDATLKGGAGGWRSLKTTDLGGGGGGGGGGGDASAANQLLMLAAIGTPADPPWDGVTESASLISVMKAVALNTAYTIVDEGA